jgi:hypothetical protein
VRWHSDMDDEGATISSTHRRTQRIMVRSYNKPMTATGTKRFTLPVCHLPYRHL